MSTWIEPMSIIFRHLGANESAAAVRKLPKWILKGWLSWRLQPRRVIWGWAIWIHSSHVHWKICFYFGFHGVFLALGWFMFGCCAFKGMLSWCLMRGHWIWTPKIHILSWTKHDCRICQQYGLCLLEKCCRIEIHQIHGGTSCKF